MAVQAGARSFVARVFGRIQQADQADDLDLISGNLDAFDWLFGGAPTGAARVVVTLISALFLPGIFLIPAFQFALSSYRPSGLALVLDEALYVTALSAMVLARIVPTRLRMWVAFGVAYVLSTILITSAGPATGLGYTALVGLTFVVVFRLGGRQSAAGLGLIVALVCATLGASDLARPNRSTGGLADFASALGLVLAMACLGAMLRSRRLLIRRLQATQAQLRAEMEHTAELAAARERTRIARDVHDVLAHSLTVLSVQVQATRQLISTQPERAATLLDEMAAVLRESLAESRRVVGMLRATAPTAAGSGDVAARLAALAERFTERAGVQCVVRESGTPWPVGEEGTAALQLALQEALTNAYRHGGARHVWAELRWEPRQVTLNIRDDGAPKVDGAPHGAAAGHGLRGMAERAEALGGWSTAGPQEQGGFQVELGLPRSAEQVPTRQGVA